MFPLYITGTESIGIFDNDPSDINKNLLVVNVDSFKFVCQFQPEDTSYCVPWRYPHPTVCCKYVECNVTCHVTEVTCDTVSGDDTILLYFSNTTQDCVLPEDSNCTSIYYYYYIINK